MKRYDLELTATGPVMEERQEGCFVPFSEISGLADTVVRMGDRCTLLSDLLRELRDGIEGEWCFPCDLAERIDAALAGKLPVPVPVPVAPSLDYVQGASDFKQELLKSTKSFVHPHIEGVFAVFNNHHERAMLASAQKPE